MINRDAFLRFVIETRGLDIARRCEQEFPNCPKGGEFELLNRVLSESPQGRQDITDALAMRTQVVGRFVPLMTDEEVERKFPHKMVRNRVIERIKREGK